MEDRQTETRVSQYVDDWPGVKRLHGGIITSLDISTPDGRKKLVASQSKPCESLDRYINKTLEIVDVLCHPVISDPADGYSRPHWIRTVLYLADGTMIQCGSEGILKALRLASIMFGPPPWCGRRGVLRQQQLSDSRRWYAIEWEEEGAA